MIDATSAPGRQPNFAGTCPVVMGTFYNGPDDARFAMFKGTLRSAWEVNLRTDGLYPVIVVDGSPDEFHEQVVAAAKEILGELVTVLRAEKGGIFPQNFQGLLYAFTHGARKALRTEPEKSGLFNLETLAEIFSALDDCDLLVVGRTNAAQATVPLEQRLTETVMSSVMAAFGLPLDTAAGPRAMTVEGFKLFREFDPKKYGDAWQYMWVTLFMAILQGVKIGGVLVDLRYPLEVAVDEEGVERHVRRRVFQADLILPVMIYVAWSMGIKPTDAPTGVDWQNFPTAPALKSGA